MPSPAAAVARRPNRRLIALLILLALATAPGWQWPGAADPILVADTPGYRLFVDPGGRMVHLQLPLDDYVELTEGERPSTAHARRLSTIVHDHFQESFDFLVFAFDERQPWVGSDTLSGFNIRARVVAGGLGLGEVRRFPGWGTEGPLASVSFLKEPPGLRTLLLHELMHTWGQAVVPTDWPAHWGRASVGGQLGGWTPGTLRRRGGGVFEARENAVSWKPMQFDRYYGQRQAYAPLELYLMGLLPADSVPPVEVAREARGVSRRGSAFTAAGFDTVSIAEIVAAHGARLPAWPHAQRSFRGMVVIVSMLPLPAGAWERWGAVVEEAGRAGPDGDRDIPNFWEATGGRSTLRLDGLLETLRYDLATGVERGCAPAEARDSLALMQERVLAVAPPRIQFVRDEPTGILEGYRPAHGYAVARGLGLVLENKAAADPMPQKLFYLPVDTTLAFDWSDPVRVRGRFELVGWGYTLPHAEGGAPPRRGCIPRDAWLLHEPAWLLRDGTEEHTPGATGAPERPAERTDIRYWRSRSLDLHVWRGSDGVPTVSHLNPLAPERGVQLTAGIYVGW